MGMGVRHGSSRIEALEGEAVKPITRETYVFQHGERTVEVTVTTSAGRDDALVVFIDTPHWEPDGSDGKGGLRVLINDDDTYVGQPYR